MNLKHEAAVLQELLKANRRDSLNDDNAADVQALCVAEEAGEMVGAYRRFTGRARRLGTHEELAHEIADVLIVTAIFAELVDVDIDEAIASKLTVIYSRGWKEETA